MKLYHVTVELDYYALANSSEKAKGFAREAVNDYNLNDVADASEVKPDDYRGDWENDELIYHSGKTDISLGEAWPKE